MLYFYHLCASEAIISLSLFLPRSPYDFPQSIESWWIERKNAITAKCNALYEILKMTEAILILIKHLGMAVFSSRHTQFPGFARKTDFQVWSSQDLSLYCIPCDGHKNQRKKHNKRRTTYMHTYILMSVRLASLCVCVWQASLPYHCQWLSQRAYIDMRCQIWCQFQCITHCVFTHCARLSIDNFGIYGIRFKWWS